MGVRVREWDNGRVCSTNHVVGWVAVVCGLHGVWILLAVWLLLVF